MSDAELESKQLLSLISHELRTPLTSVMGFAQLIAMDADASPKIERWADMIFAAGTSLQTMIESLVIFASAEGFALPYGGTPPVGIVTTPFPFAPAKMIAGAAAHVRPYSRPAARQSA
ncbi:MAG: histidine kinase dimerization/phospho-acceptor domain-containing protein [Acidimicrobiales bacterium]